MAIPNTKGWLAILFIAFCLAIPFGFTYYVSTAAFKAKFARWQGTMPRVPEGAGPARPGTLNHQVVLVKGKRIHVANTSLVYHGMDKGVIRLALYLEELDPDQAYVQTFSGRDLAGKTLRLGDVLYTVISVSKTTLMLKIVQNMGTG